ncbi:sialate O-acetylesterase [Gayadomonas joobiniege]|uniref:sialate O-acetylesterase n=1 Tax=Gayadomonas joobiniege TaxID=1234606 RepID=UPI000367648B|nr:sialate O-acetylesterase [Gayadomonas joobiniege]
MNKLALWSLTSTLMYCTQAQAEVSLPSVFADKMVLQQKQENPIWGKASPGESIRISLADQTYKTKADADGNWRVKLAKMPAGGPYNIKVQAQNSIEIKDVLVGEVWMCSGQSNMEWRVKDSNHPAVETLTANYSDIRIMKVPRVGIDTPQFDIDAKWETVSPSSIRDFSAICYFYGRRLHHALGVPVGLIKNSWGGTPIEAWIPRDALDNSGEYEPMLSHWDQLTADFDPATYQQQLKAFNAWNKAGRPAESRVDKPKDPISGGKRPANIFNGVVNPTVGYGIRGVIWYQGEANGNRGYQYRSLFPLLINTWRERWGQGDFPFYWVQLADFRAEQDTPSEYSDWAELREAQSMTLSVPNTGEAIAIDLGEGRNIHPTNKQDVADRLVRHPLAKVYGFNLTADSPRFDELKIDGDKAIVSFKNVTKKLYSQDTWKVDGFYIAGDDQQFVKADAKIIGKNKVQVFSEQVKNPVAVRYGWEDNPVVNLYDKGELPVAPFRTDDWPLRSLNVVK